MPLASTSNLGDGLTMQPLSHIVTRPARPHFHKLCVPHLVTECDNALMDSDKNGGPNYLRAWRLFRKGKDGKPLTQEELADRVGTNANMIQYLETGERGLSSKWLRRLSPALETTPGMLLDNDPNELDSDLVEIWVNGNARQKKQIAEIAKTLLRTGSAD
jgi:transcriptional regulator with XRE-family HTH domain